MDYENVTQAWNKTSSFLGNENSQTTNKTLFCAQKHKPLTMLSLTAGRISSAFCIPNIGIPVPKECRMLRNFEISFYPT
jgi:hypothetical protein